MTKPPEAVRFHIAQINVGRLSAPIESPQLEPFVSALERVNALADAAPGFVWRLKSEGAVNLAPNADPRELINMSVWTDIPSLGAFVYRTAHREIMVRRRSFFETPAQAFQTLWWVPAGTTPTVEEGMARLAHLRAHGPSAHAFTFREPFPPAADAEPTAPVLDECA